MLDACPVAPGLVSEEVSERNNGKVRAILPNLTRKMSRLKMLTDLVNRLLMISDPVMLEYVREKSLKNREVKKLSPEVQAMLPEAENYNLDE